MDIDLTLTGMLGVFVPMLVGVLVKLETPRKVKAALAVALSVALGVVLAVSSGDITWSLQGDIWAQIQQVLKYVAVVAICAQTAYQMWIEPSGLAAWIQENINF
jgi:uncharacterized membrane protein YbjE (DUF340 family)